MVYVVNISPCHGEARGSIPRGAAKFWASMDSSSVKLTLPKGSIP